MKKLINDPGGVLGESLRGLDAAHPELRVDHEHRIVYRATAKDDGKVALVSGGGSGHEPLHAGFVGEGMLDAACAGEVFTSPTPDQMAEATRVVDRGAGVLHIVKNYTGDVMNFDMAGELAALESDVEVRTVITQDDVAVESSTFTAGRRGVGVTVLLEKIVGAAAEAGADLDAVDSLAQRVSAAGRSMGVALTSCTVPSAGRPTFDLPEDEIEVGVGIHGEPGRHRQPLVGASEIAGLLVDPVLADHDFTAGPTIALLNGMGGTPLLELYLMYGEVARAARAGRRPGGPVIGGQLHHLAGHGRSIADPARRRRRDARFLGRARAHHRAALGHLSMTDIVTRAQLLAWLSTFRDSVHEHRDHLTDLDAAIGDADHGTNLTRGMDAVMEALGADENALPDPADLLKTVGMRLVSTVGGASGPLYGTFFLRAATTVGHVETVDAQTAVAMVRAGVDGLAARGKAEPGDKTMVDALSPAVEALADAVTNGDTLATAMRAAAEAAAAGRDATTPMQARKGRASYLGERSIGHTDPGAASATLLLEAFADALG